MGCGVCVGVRGGGKCLPFLVGVGFSGFPSFGNFLGFMGFEMLEVTCLTKFFLMTSFG